jgi:hypothetical protein
MFRVFVCVRTDLLLIIAHIKKYATYSLTSPHGDVVFGAEFLFVRIGGSFERQGCFLPY